MKSKKIIKSYFTVEFNTNHQTTLVEPLLTSPFVGALYLDSVAAEGITSEQPKEVRKVKFESGKVVIM